MDDTSVLTESPEEKAFFDSKGGETVTVDQQPEPELPLDPQPEATSPVETKEPEKPHTVPLAALLEERAKYKKLNEKIEKLQSLIQPQEQPKAPVDPDVDPIGALKELHQERAQERAERERQTQEYNEYQQTTTIGQQAANAFRQVKPDFDEAYNYLRHSRANQLMEAGQVSSPEELNYKILAEEKQIIQMCAGMGISPAAMMYHLASAAGYAKAESAPASIAAPTPEEKVKMAAEAQRKAAPPIKAASANSGPIDLKALLKLDDDEFDKATSGNNWRKLAGG